MTRIIEVLLNSNIYKDELSEFIKTTLESLSDKIEVEVKNSFSNNTQIVISLVEKKLGDFDIEFYEKYKNREFKFLFYYFQESEIDIDDIDEDIFKRIEFKSEVSKDIKLCNDFRVLYDLKESIKIRLKESISDLINRTNYSKINSFVINRSKGAKFYDSDNNLRKVDNYLRRERRISLINGLGGVGKTTLAIEYSVKALNEQIYDYIVWFDVESGIEKEIKKFAIEYLLSDDDGKQEKAYYQKRFSDFLNDFPNTLIILDNYEESSIFEKELSNFLNDFKRYDIIITSRKEITKLNIHPIKLEVFQNINDALEMFKLTSTRIYSFSEETTIKEIIKYLGNLPLALEITANFLSETQMAVNDYLEALKDEGLKLFEKLEDYKSENHLESLSATLKINSQIIKNESSFKLLKVFALISPEVIEKEIIEEYLTKELNIKAFDKTLSLKDLEKFSYIKVSKDGYSMHRLLQEAIRNEFLKSDDEKVELITKISLSVFHWFVDSLNDSKYGSYFNATVTQIEYLLEEWKSLNIDEAEIYLYSCISAYILDISENPKTTLENIKKAIELLDNIKVEDREKAIVYNQYGNILNLNSNYKEAEKFYKKVLELSSNNELIAGIYDSLARIYKKQKEYLKAEEFYKKSLELTKKIFGENNIQMTITYNNLGLLYKEQKKYDEAEKFYKKDLMITRKKLGENHPDVAKTYYNLAYLYESCFKYPQSFKNFYLALKIRLNLELSPINKSEMKKSFNGITQTLTKLTRVPNNQKESINRQIDELNRLFAEKKLKHKIKKLK